MMGSRVKGTRKEERGEKQEEISEKPRRGA